MPERSQRQVTSTLDQFSLEPVPRPPLPSVLGGRGDPCREPCGSLQQLLDKLDGDDALVARLLVMREVEDVVGRHRKELDAGCGTVIDTHGATQSALRELGTFRTMADPSAARRRVEAVEARHAGDGAEDRRRRRPWESWLPWAVIGGAAVFETWFFGQIFRYLAGVDASTSEGRIALIIAYLPGAMLAAALVLAGTLAGEWLGRRKHAREGRPEQDLPKPVSWLALPFVGVLLLIVGFLAWARAQFVERVGEAQAFLAQGAAGTDGGAFPEWAVVLLMVTVTVAAIGVKAVSYNPFADSADAAAAELETALEEYASQCERVEQALVALEQAWDRLRGSLLSSLDAVQHRWVVLQRAWPADGGPGPDEFPSQRAVPPDNPVGEQAVSGLPEVDGLLVWLEQTPNPMPALGPLRHAWLVLSERPPDPLRARFRELVDELDRGL